MDGNRKHWISLDSVQFLPSNSNYILLDRNSPKSNFNLVRQRNHWAKMFNSERKAIRNWEKWAFLQAIFNFDLIYWSDFTHGNDNNSQFFKILPEFHTVHAISSSGHMFPLDFDRIPMVQFPARTPWGRQQRGVPWQRGRVIKPPGRPYSAKLHGLELSLEMLYKFPNKFPFSTKKVTIGRKRECLKLNKTWKLISLIDLHLNTSVPSPSWWLSTFFPVQNVPSPNTPIHSGPFLYKFNLLFPIFTQFK